jgi:hypothetical protein
MDNTHIMIIVLTVSIFAIIGIVCGLVIYNSCPGHIRDLEEVKNSYIFLIISLVFVIIFDTVYLSWHLLHNHKAIKIKHSTQMGHHM